MPLPCLEHSWVSLMSGLGAELTGHRHSSRAYSRLANGEPAARPVCVPTQNEQSCLAHCPKQPQASQNRIGTKSGFKLAWTWWHIPVTTALGRCWQEDFWELKASISYKARPPPQNTGTTKEKWERANRMAQQVRRACAANLDNLASIPR